MSVIQQSNLLLLFFFSHSLDECGTFEVSCHVAGLAPYPRPEVDGLFLFLSLFSVLISFLFSLFLCDCGYCHCNCFLDFVSLLRSLVLMISLLALLILICNFLPGCNDTIVKTDS